MALPSYADFLPAINHFSQGLLDTAIRSLLLLGLVSLAVRSMRRASAATRHWAWLMGIVGLLVLPVISAVLPGWRILPALDRRPLAASTASLVAPASELNAKENPGNPASSPQSPQYDLSTTNHALSTPPAPDIHAQPAAAPLTVDHPAAAATLTHRAALPWACWLALAWLLGCTMVLGHLLLGYRTGMILFLT
jgi:hypothetical protein